MENSTDKKLEAAAETNLAGDHTEEHEREELIEDRRLRQGGKKGGNAKLILGLGLVGILSITALVGPQALMDMFSDEVAIPVQPVSQVDLEVKAPRPVDGERLDFGVEGAPETTSNEDLAMLERIAQLEKMLSAVQNRKLNGGVPTSELERIEKETLKSITDAVKAERAIAAKEMEKLRSAIEEKERNAAAELEEMRLQLANDREADARKAEEDEKKAEAARELEHTQRNSPSVILDSGVTAQAEDGEGGLFGRGSMTNDQRYLASAADAKVVTAVAKSLTDPSRTVVQGTIISAVLETAIDTELPGALRAQVTQPVFSYDGQRILMPAGTMVVGQFSTDIKTGQKRVLIAWNRAITPDGQSIALGSTGTDTLGRSGTTGNVNNRYGLKLGVAAVSSVVSAVPDILEAVVRNKLGVPKPERTRSSVQQILLPNGQTATIDAAEDEVEDNRELETLSAGVNASGALAGTAQGILQDFLTLPPVIRVPQGEEIRIFVNRDLLFK